MASEEFIKRDMLISDIVRAHPESVPIIMSFGLHCVGCHVSQFETLEQGCQGHGMPDDVIDKLVAELNDFVAKQAKTSAAEATE